MLTPSRRKASCASRLPPRAWAIVRLRRKKPADSSPTSCPVWPASSCSPAALAVLMPNCRAMRACSRMRLMPRSPISMNVWVSPMAVSLTKFSAGRRTRLAASAATPMGPGICSRAPRAAWAAGGTPFSWPSSPLTPLPMLPFRMVPTLPKALPRPDAIEDGRALNAPARACCRAAAASLASRGASSQSWTFLFLAAAACRSRVLARSAPLTPPPTALAALSSSFSRATEPSMDFWSPASLAEIRTARLAMLAMTGRPFYPRSAGACAGILRTGRAYVAPPRHAGRFVLPAASAASSPALSSPLRRR